ncbi:MAG: Calx-beta domain-containing protein, partial [Nitrospirota bacterium]
TQSSTNESGTMSVTAQLSTASSFNVTVPFTLGGNASTTDYTITASPLTILAGSTTATATITITSDTLDENNETVILTMGTSTNATTTGTTTHTTTITDDDDPPTVTLFVSQITLNENGGATSTQVTAILGTPSGRDVTVTLSRDGTATSGTDYALDNTITIAAGDPSQPVTLTVMNDLDAELDEILTITMTCNITCLAGTPFEATVTIVSDDLPATPDNLQITFDVNKILLNWNASPGAASYQVFEDLNNSGLFSQVGPNIGALNISIPIAVHHHNWPNARYKVRACNSQGACGPDSLTIDTIGKSSDATGFAKAANVEANDGFGFSVSVSGDGQTLAIGAPYEDSAMQSDSSNNAALDSGAVYIFQKDSDGNWSQEAYLKASLPDAGDAFGYAVSLSDDGNTLAVGAPYEASNATSTIVVNPNGTSVAEQNNSALASGAATIFTRSGTLWTAVAYMKASNTETFDLFGTAVSLSGDALYLAVSAPEEDSVATNTIISNPNNVSAEEQNNSGPDSGAVYLFAFDSVSGVWSHQAYIKPIVIGTENLSTDGDNFGTALSLDGTGSLLAVGVPFEDGSATGINGATNEAAFNAGAVHTYTRTGSTWIADDSVKASNTGAGDFFGSSVALSDDGLTLAIGAPYEYGNATGVIMNPTGTLGAEMNNSAREAGAAYLYTRNIVTSNWETKAYVKASNTPSNSVSRDQFGLSVSLNQTGNMLVVGAPYEDSATTGVNGLSNELASNSGAAYTFIFNAGIWSQNGYIKASNTGIDNHFGSSVSLSHHSGLFPTNINGRLVIGAPDEDSSITPGVSKGSDPTDNNATGSGAVYLY